jgi:hypothetical protein
MLPLSDGIPARRFPIVNVLLIVENFAVFIFYVLPHLNAAVSQPQPEVDRIQPPPAAKDASRRAPTDPR